MLSGAFPRLPSVDFSSLCAIVSVKGASKDDEGE